MGIFDRLRGEFVDVIEWLDPTHDTIAYRFERHGNEIKMGAQLTVRPGQQAVFVNEGRVADAFEPGMYELSTANLPVLSTLMGWSYGFESPFKSEVYFFNTKIFADLKWGTANPIALRDPEIGPVRLRAFGTYSIRVADPVVLLNQLVSTDGLFQIDEIVEQLRNTIVSTFSAALGRDRISLFDFAARYREMGDTLRDEMQPEMAQLGIELTQLLVENISLPPEVEAALDKRSSMNLLGSLQDYTQFQAANALEAAANNPSGGGNSPLEWGVGMAMGQQMSNAMQQQQRAAGPPPPPPVEAQWHLSVNGQTAGPFPASQLLQQGITPQTYVWKTGMSGWLRAAEVPELQALFGTMPPPPPPGP